MAFKHLVLAGLLAFSLQLGSLAAPIDDLIAGASMGDLHRVQVALAAGADINGSIYDLETGYEFTEPALVQAARNGRFEVARYLLQHGARPDTTLFGNTALIAAVDNDNLKMVQLLLEYRANPNIGLEYDSMGKANADSDGQTPVMHAAGKGNLELVKLLISHGANPFQKGMVSVGTGDALAYALSVEQAPLPMIQYLLTLKFPLATDASYLNLTVVNDHHDLVKLLLQRGARINLPDSEDGMTALSQATLQSDLAMVKLLLDNGANPFWLDKRNQNALSSLEINTDIDARAVRQAFALAGNKRLEALRQALRGRINYNAADESGWTPLMFAIAGKDRVMLTQFLSRGAEARIKDKTGRPPLILAVLVAPELVGPLLYRPIDINAIDGNGYTALMHAAELGQLETVKSLLRNRARVDIKDAYDTTALSLAEKAGYKEIVALLKRAGAK